MQVVLNFRPHMSKDAGSKPGAEQKKGAGSKDLPIDLPLHVKLQQSLELYGPLAVGM